MSPSISIIRPADRAAWLTARRKDVTASQVGALFGAHEFLTMLELWANKTGRLPEHHDETPPMQRGRLLEPVAVQLLRERYPEWTITHNAAENTYYRDAQARLGATPDVIAMRGPRGAAQLGVVQIKSVEASTFRRKWLDDAGEVDPPLWIALQATLEAYLAGATWAAVAPLVIGHGLEMPLVEVPLVDGVIDAMKAKAAEFWQMVDDGREPTADYWRDGALLDRLYGHADPEHEVDLSGDNEIPSLLEARAAHLTAMGSLKAEIEATDTAIKAKLGHATVAHIGQGRRITWLPQHRKGAFVGPSTTRVLRYPTERN